MSSKITQEYADTHVERLADLSKYDQKLFRKDNGSRCPGLVRVDFYGDARPTWALVLIDDNASKRKARLVLARQLPEGWRLKLVEETDGRPVVWREGPGKYEGVYECKTLRAKYPVIVFCGYGSWAILYSWTGTDIQKIWLSD